MRCMLNERTPVLGVLCLCLALTGCGPSDDGGSDAGSTDTATSNDTGPGMDTGVADTGESPDTGGPDSSTVDGGSETGMDSGSDTGMSDSEMPDGGGDDGIEVAGQWVSNFGTSYMVDAQKWGDNTVVDYDNADNVAVLKVPEDAMFNAGKYIRYDWIDPSEGEFFYCQTVAMGKDTAEAARNSSNMADPSAPLEGGCNTMNDFPWTLMNEPFEIAGAFTTPDGSVEITDAKWGDQSMKDWNNAANWVVTQTPMSADTNAGKYNVVQYTDPANNGEFFVCPVAEGLDSLKAARQANKSADPSQPAQGGCDDDAWAKYTQES